MVVNSVVLTLRFGAPVAKEMTDFGALLNISATTNMEEKKKHFQ